ncbi:MAG: hypothetical protein H7837_06945 [Magnetococcus sp. MYC-9]
MSQHLMNIQEEHIHALPTGRVSQGNGQMGAYLSVAQVKALEATDLAAIGAAGIASLSSQQVNVLNKDQMSAAVNDLTASQIEWMTAAQKKVHASVVGALGAS